MLAWWAFNNEGQSLLSLETVFEIEHIFARSRQDKEKSLVNSRNMEILGNKSILEKRINIRASDYRFADKKKYYQGYINARGQEKKGTKVQELLDLSVTQVDFTENNIENRTKMIINACVDFLRANDLLV